MAGTSFSPISSYLRVEHTLCIIHRLDGEHPREDIAAFFGFPVGHVAKGRLVLAKGMVEFCILVPAVLDAVNFEEGVR